MGCSWLKRASDLWPVLSRIIFSFVPLWNKLVAQVTLKECAVFLLKPAAAHSLSGTILFKVLIPTAFHCNTSPKMMKSYPVLQWSMFSLQLWICNAKHVAKLFTLNPQGYLSQPIISIKSTISYTSKSHFVAQQTVQFWLIDLITKRFSSYY